MGIKEFFKNAFADMKEGAKQQHEVDKANFKAVKAESKAHFEENRGMNTIKRAKANAKKNWDDAHMSINERKQKMKDERVMQVEQANQRRADAEKRLEKLKKNN